MTSSLLCFWQGFLLYFISDSLLYDMFFGTLFLILDCLCRWILLSRSFRHRGLRCVNTMLSSSLVLPDFFFSGYVLLGIGCGWCGAVGSWRLACSCWFYICMVLFLVVRRSWTFYFSEVISVFVLFSKRCWRFFQWTLFTSSSAINYTLPF